MTDQFQIAFRSDAPAAATVVGGRPEWKNAPTAHDRPAARRAAGQTDGDLRFWRDLRSAMLPIRGSQYDITSICNLACEGCLFFSGSDFRDHADVSNLDVIDAFFAAEAARGVRYGYFGGAEPALAEAKLAAAAAHIPYGVVFTNGTRRISREIPYRLHVSVWGGAERSKEARGADIFARQTRNYRDDNRAVFVFTVTAQNIGDIRFVADQCADGGLKLTFSHYSPTSTYLGYIGGGTAPDKYHRAGTGTDNLTLQEDDLKRSHDVIAGLLASHADTILYSDAFNDWTHDPEGLYSDIDESGVAIDCGVRLTERTRHYNTDLAASSRKCCTPNVECRTCRLYAQSFVTALARQTRRMLASRERASDVPLWRLWCKLFLNDARFNPLLAP